MNISITPELEKFVHEKVASGMYNSASEVMREALRLLAERDELHRKRIAAMDAFIDEGYASGDLIEPDVVWAEMDAIIDAAEKNRA
jgi:antitoxin ParD1/3/4